MRTFFRKMRRFPLNGPSFCNPGPLLLSCPPNSAAVFLTVSTAQMMVWAKKKHRNYKKEFGEKYPKGRWMMIPGIF